MMTRGSKSLSSSALSRDMSSVSLHRPAFSPPALLDSTPVSVTGAEIPQSQHKHHGTFFLWNNTNTIELSSFGTTSLFPREFQRPDERHCWLSLASLLAEESVCHA